LPQAQPQPQRKYRDEGLVEHKVGLATVKAADPRPLMQAVSALNEEYGWLVDYEDPPYASDSELIDSTNLQWKAAHPNAPRSTIPAGGDFQTDFEETAAIMTPAGQEAALRKIVAGYNRSGNPGKFNVRPNGAGRFVVVGSAVKNQAGKEQNVTPILDTKISIPARERTAAETLQLIFKEVSARGGGELGLGWVPNNLIYQARVNVGGDNVSARDLLVQTLNATGRPVVYSLMYFETTHKYLLNAFVAARAIRDTYGRKTMIPLDSKPVGRPN
jgi:hypothetical protein